MIKDIKECPFSSKKCRAGMLALVGILCVAVVGEGTQEAIIARLEADPVDQDIWSDEIVLSAVPLADVDDPTISPVRDPFWPVGYERPAPEEEEDDLLVVDAVEWPNLPIRGRSRAPDGTFRALIAGVGIVREGQVVSIERQGLWFHWRITKIDTRGVRFVRLGVTAERRTEAEWNRMLTP